MKIRGTSFMDLYTSGKSLWNRLVDFPEVYRFCVLLILLCTGTLTGHAKKEWEEVKGSNFIIYYRDHDVPADFVQTVLEEAEADFKSITEHLGIARYQGWSWDKRASIYIYRDGDDYVKNGGQAGWSHGVALVTSKSISTYPAASGFFDSILPHELSHIILHEFVGPLAHVPVWFDEGVAMYQEKARRPGSHQTVRKAIENGQFIPLTQLTDMRLYNDSEEAKVQLFYAESASIVNFMVTQLGENHFYKLCRALKEGDRFENALPKAYMRVKNIEDLNKQWTSFLEEQ